MPRTHPHAEGAAEITQSDPWTRGSAVVHGGCGMEVEVEVEVEARLGRHGGFGGVRQRPETRDAGTREGRTGFSRMPVTISKCMHGRSRAWYFSQFDRWGACGLWIGGNEGVLD